MKIPCLTLTQVFSWGYGSVMYLGRHRPLGALASVVQIKSAVSELKSIPFCTSAPLI